MQPLRAPRVRLALKLGASGLLRLALVLAFGSSLAFTLGLLYPVQRELDLARYEYALHQYEVEGVFPAELAPAVSAAIGPDTCLVSIWLTSLHAGSTDLGPTELDATSPACSTGLSRFPAATLVTAGKTDTTSWIDLNTDAARKLGVAPGDTVDVMVTPDQAPARLTLRNVYAVRATGAAAAAMAPADVLFAQLPGGQPGGYGLALTSTPPSQFLPRLERDPLRSELEKAKGYPPLVTTVDARLARASDLSSNSVGLVRTIGTLAVLGVLALTLRELDIYRRRCVSVTKMVHRLGGSAGGLLGGFVGLAAFVGVVALSLGLILAYAAYRFGIVASSMPPTLGSLLLAAWAGAAAVPVVFALVMGPLSVRRVVSS